MQPPAGAAFHPHVIGLFAGVGQGDLSSAPPAQVESKHAHTFSQMMVLQASSAAAGMQIIPESEPKALDPLCERTLSCRHRPRLQRRVCRLRLLQPPQTGSTFKPFVQMVPGAPDLYCPSVDHPADVAAHAGPPSMSMDLQLRAPPPSSENMLRSEVNERESSRWKG